MSHRCRFFALVLSLSFAAGASADPPPFLHQYCTRCHGEKKPEANLPLHKLSPAPVKRAELDAWKSVLEKIEIGEMPPEDAKQPPADERLKFVAAIKKMLTSAGEPPDESRWLVPARGNYLDHDTLFSGRPVDPAVTRPRLWRVTGQAYENFIQQKNLQFRLGIKTYGEDKIHSPWELRAQKDFNDYANAHRIGDADIEYHLRNVTRVARLMVAKFAGQRPSDAAIGELSIVLKTGRESTPEQIRAAVVASFDKILNRVPADDEVQRFAGFLTTNLKTLDGEKAVEQFLIALLLRPEVMYRLEFPTTPGQRSLLPPMMLARAIAFALTDDEPDEPLRQAAVDGKLTSREAVREHVERLLNDRGTAKPRLLRFFQEYFGYTTAGDVFKDEVTLAEHGLKKQTHAPDVYVADTNRLVEWVLERDEQVLRELLTTSKTFVLAGDNKSIKSYAEHLRAGGAPRPPEPGKPVKEDGFGYRGTATPDAVLAVYEIKLHVKDWYDDRPYEMPAEHRRGILTHPSWLIAHTTNFDNHAIDRGRWIREKLLGGRIPDVPITVDATLPDEPHVPLRERMRVTRVEYCWKCHQYMDPLGLAFEHYDHFGRFRQAEMVVDKEATEARQKAKKSGARVMKHLPLDTSGVVAKSGDPALDGPVKDAHELIGRLAKSERVEQVFVRHAFRYFLGRNETYSDGPALIAAQRAYREHGGSMKALVASLLTSDAFLYRGMSE